MSAIEKVAVGERIVLLEAAVTRLDLAAYCLASGDRNPIHWSDDAAQAAGLADVIAHGMLTMGLASRAVIEWAAGGGELTDMAVRFAQPLTVPPSVRGVAVSIAATVRELSPAEVVLDLEVTDADGGALLTASTATLRRQEG